MSDTSLNTLSAEDSAVLIDLQDVIDSSETKDCRSYSQAFWTKTKETQKTGDTSAEAVFTTLTAVTAPELKSESTEEHFTNCFRPLLDAQLNFLSLIVVDISDPELQARVADVLWVKRKDYQSALLAIPAYLQSAARLENPKRWRPCFQRIERSLRLALKLRNQEHIYAAFTHIEAVLDRYQGEDELWLSVKLMELLQEHKYGEPTKYASLANQAAQTAEAKGNFRKARSLWNIEAVWHRKKDDYNQEFAASMRAAETYVKESNAALENSSQRHLIAATHLQKAIMAFRSIRGTSEETVTAKQRAEVLHQKLLKYQEKVSDEMKTYSQSIDVSAVAKKAEQEVSGKSLQEALFALSIMCEPTNVVELRQQIEEYGKTYIASHVAPVTIMNAAGKVVSRQPGSTLFGDFETREAAIYFEMCQKATNFNHQLQGKVAIDSARYQIMLEHSIHINDIRDLITHSPFVPQGREFLLAKGIHAGLVEDWVTATHILIPQIENSIRHILNERGVITSGLDDDGIQQEHTLTSILDCPKLSPILGEGTLFDLKCLLIEHAGSNLRNRMAHGLISDFEFVNPALIYVWWLTVRLCFVPILNQSMNEE